MKKQPWLYKAWTDLLFIIGPPFVCLLIIALFPHWFSGNHALPEWSWVVLVLCIDVSHVYSTLFRTYFEPRIFTEQRTRLILIPVFAFVAGVILYSFSSLLFWRLLAYLAVYHFIRQQYGFLRLYGRKENGPKAYRVIDKVTIYAATLYPILYWHFEGDRKFHWFIEGDFMLLKWPVMNSILLYPYLIILIIYFVKELIILLRNKQVNIPRNGVVWGTALSWYVGIVHLNGDLSFTLLNVVSHGIPYMALVWIAGRKERMRKEVSAAEEIQLFKPGLSRVSEKVFSMPGIFLFLGCILLLAFTEEALWDTFVWHEHGETFSFLQDARFMPGKELLTVLVPALAVPQITHYVIDGYIWKISKGHVQ